MSFFLDRTSQLAESLTATLFTSLNSSLRSEEFIETVYALFRNVKKRGSKIFVIGNGGSAGIASHHVIDLINVLHLAAFTISDSNIITCMGNDYGYSTIYAKPLSVLANKGDILIAISSSGKSENILEACRVMKSKNNRVITLSGFEENNPLRSLGDLNIWTNAKDYGLVESAHFFILHTLVDGWKEQSSLSELIGQGIES